MNVQAGDGMTKARCYFGGYPILADTNYVACKRTAIQNHHHRFLYGVFMAGVCG